MSQSVPVVRSGEQGFALVMALLFTGVVLLIVVSTAASTTLTSRRGGVDERAAYQALLTAESGLNMLSRKIGEHVRTTALVATSPAQLEAWLNSLAVDTYGLGSGGSASLSFKINSSTSFTAISTSTFGTGRKVVAQDYLIVDRTLPPGMRARSGIQSGVPINATGSPSVRPVTAGNNPGNTGGGGKGGGNPQPPAAPSTAVTVVANNVSMAANSPAVNINVAEAQGLRSGDYITVSGVVFRINSVSGNSLNISQVPNPPTGQQNLTGDVGLILNAVAASYPAVTSPMVVKISNVTDFSVGETVGVGAFSATVSEINSHQQTAKLTWTNTAPFTLTEGTRIARDTLAMRSAGTITITNDNTNTLGNYQGVVNGTVSNDCTTTGTTGSPITTCRGANDPLLSSASMTQQLFGLSDEELNERVGLKTAPFTAMTGQVIRINAADFGAVFPNGNVSSKGVLIVDGNVDDNINGNKTFEGLIYIRGCINRANGNLTINGAIAIRGGVGCTSSILGNTTVNFDLVKLRSVLMNATGYKQAVPVASTWRMR